MTITRLKILLTAGIILVSSVTSILFILWQNAPELNGRTVGMTYYGGEYDESIKRWRVDNTFQCERIKSGQFSAEELDAVPTDNCDDDPGVGYFHDIPLHDAMSFAELSVNPDKKDFSALGNLPALTKLQVEYEGRCIIVEKLDVGLGGSAVQGQPRSIDLWWQTARSLGFSNGFDLAKVTYVNQSTPLTQLGETVPCMSVAGSKTRLVITVLGVVAIGLGLVASVFAWLKLKSKLSSYL